MDTLSQLDKQVIIMDTLTKEARCVDERLGSVTRRRVKLQNGATLSIQASARHCSEPMVVFPFISDYNSVQVTVLTLGGELDYRAIQRYTSSYPANHNWQIDSFAFVPIDKLVEFIEVNGGLMQTSEDGTMDSDFL